MNKDLIKKYSKDLQFFRVKDSTYAHHNCFKEYVPDIVGIDRGNLVITTGSEFLLLKILDCKKLGANSKELELREYINKKGILLGKSFWILTSESIEALNSTMIKYGTFGDELGGFRSKFANLFWEAETLSL